MAKLFKRNTLENAAAWLAEKLMDDDITPDYLVELGRDRVLNLHAGIPNDVVMLPEGVNSPGLYHTPVWDGFVEFDPALCHVIQTQGSVTTREVELNGFSYPLRQEVKITLDVLRIKKEVLEGYMKRCNGQGTQWPDYTRAESKEFLSGQRATESSGTSENDETLKPMTAVVGIDTKIPGKMPNVSIGKQAIKAAWQIECETQRAATSEAVIERLQNWADTGSVPETLLSSVKAKRGVEWRTKDGKTKLYDIGSCAKTLNSWMNSRPQPEPSRNLDPIDGEYPR